MPLRSVLLLSGACMLAPSAAAAQWEPLPGYPCDSTCEFARSYWTLTGLIYPQPPSNPGAGDALLMAGVAVPTADGGWTARLEAGAGLSLYSSDPQKFGWLTGVHFALARAWTGDYVALGDFPAELYAVAGGATYLAEGLQERPRERAVIHAVAFGVGLRVRERTIDSGLVNFELLHEQRLGGWGSRLFVRISGSRARALRDPPTLIRPLD